MYIYIYLFIYINVTPLSLLELNGTCNNEEWISKTTAHAHTNTSSNMVPLKLEEKKNDPNCSSFFLFLEGKSRKEKERERGGRGKKDRDQLIATPLVNNSAEDLAVLSSPSAQIYIQNQKANSRANAERKALQIK